MVCVMQKMARVICQLVNGQVDMTVTTHSDIILQHMNNMISLSERENREELCRRLGYGFDALLSREQIKVYQIFERQEGGCWQRIPFVHRPVPMKRDCQGILRGQVTVEAG